MSEIEDDRILIRRGGLLVPRVEQKPCISSAGSGWSGLRLESHHLIGPAESTGMIDGFQICYNLSGPVAAEWLVEGRRVSASLQKGDLCLATHGEFRSVAWRRSYDLLLLSLAPSLMADVAGELCDISPVELQSKRGFSDSNIESICQLLLADVMGGTPTGPIYGEHLACSLCFYLAHHFGVTPARQDAPESSLPGPVLKRVCELIEARLSTPLGLQDLAREANLSRFYFSRMFRNSTGDTPYRYLTKRRIARAKKLLAAGCSEAEVAEATGFSSRSHLASLFRRYTGTTPHQFRTAHFQRGLVR